jgi:outer membrane receptor for Fe3+-dicitrate
MQTFRSKLAALSAGLITVLAALSVENTPSLGQVPIWPKTRQRNDMICFTNGATCVICGPGIINGCTTGIPYQWASGMCAQSKGDTCTDSWIDCGPQYNCTSGNPVMTNCPTTIICQ